MRTRRHPEVCQHRGIGLEGRDGVLGGLLGLVDRAGAGAGGVCWLEGEAGIGKTALLDALVTAAPDGVEVLRATGRESEVELAWAGVGGLVGPLIDAGFTEALPAVQRSALLGVLALAETVTPIEPYAVLLAVQGAVAAAAAVTPLLLVVDDLQWLDEPSRLAIEYLALRLDGVAATLVVGSRPEPDRRPPVEVEVLCPVDPVAASALLAGRGVDSASVRGRIVGEVGGNPLLLHAAADALDDRQRAGVAPLPEVLPVPNSVLRLAEARLAEVSEESQTALLVAAVAPDGDLAMVTRALAAMGRDSAALEEAERAGLIVVEEGQVRFGHPTWRSAAYHGAEAADRRAAHGAVGAAVTDPVARAWHRGLGVLGVDEGAADALDASAALLLERAAPMTAAQHFELAARLSADGALTAHRLRRAAEAVSAQGHDTVAEALLDRADALGGDRDEAARRRRLRFRMALRTGAVDEPVAGLRELADEIADVDPLLSADLLIEAVAPLVRTVRLAELLEVATAAAERAGVAADERLERRADVTLGVAQLAVGDLEGLNRLDRYQEVLEQEGAVEAGAFLAEVVGPVLSIFHRTSEAEALLATLEEELRDRAAAPALIAVLTARAMATHPRSLPGAVGHAREAVDIATAVGRPALGLLASSSLVIAAGLIGDREQALAAAEPLLASGEPGLVQTALTGVGVLQLAHGDLEDAMATYERLEREVGLSQGFVRWEPDWCEVLVRARQSDEAERILRLATGAEVVLIGSGAYARVRGMLADDLDDAAAAFESAVAWFRMVGNRVGEGRTELAWGERLRRARRRAAARDHLDRAADLFEGVGARVWAERARRELHAASGTRASGGGGIEALTGQELEVARLAATGATNQEIGRAVFLSPRTVETHLAAAYRKLGMSNRRQLVALAATEPRLRR